MSRRNEFLNRDILICEVITMEKVDYFITEWRWNCPKCSNINEINDDPDFISIVICETCGEKYELINPL